MKKAKKEYKIHKRSPELSGGEISIKDVIENVITEMVLDKNDYIWLFYLTIPYKSLKDYLYCAKLLKDQKLNSLCTFINVKSPV